MSRTSFLTLKEFQKTIKYVDYPVVVFAFGESMISKIIQIKTREYKQEIVPSHTFSVVDGFVYESTSAPDHLTDKTIPAGVRRYRTVDFFESEIGKKTNYMIFTPESAIFNYDIAEKYVHYPYGKDSIVEFLVKDKSVGESRGLICSEYVNKCWNISTAKRPSPADLYRILLNEV